MRRSTDKTLEKQEASLKFNLDNQVNLTARRVQLVGEVDSDMFKLVDSTLTELEKINNRSITLVINSDGGSVYDALAIVGRMRHSKCVIVTEGYGSIMSAATLILAAGNKRKLSEFAWIMHHEGSYSIDGRHSHIAHEVQQKEKEEEAWAKWMAAFTVPSQIFWGRAGVGRDLYIDPETAIKMGIVDVII